MLDFLKSVDISDELIKNIENNYDESVIYDLSNNQESCLKTINFLKKLSIQDVGQLLLYNIDLFMIPTEEVVTKISRFNIFEIIQKINEDPMNINLLD